MASMDQEIAPNGAIWSVPEWNRRRIIAPAYHVRNRGYLRNIRCMIHSYTTDFNVLMSL